MSTVGERLLLVVRSDTTFDTNAWWASEGLSRVLKIYIFLPYILIHYSLYLDILEESLIIVLLLYVHHL